MNLFQQQQYKTVHRFVKKKLNTHTIDEPSVNTVMYK